MSDIIFKIFEIILVPTFVAVMTLTVNKNIWSIQKRLEKIEKKIFENENIENLMKQIDEAIEYILQNTNTEYQTIMYIKFSIF
jgi:tetrahydromethanopterin S-methyltransferase subunit G